MPAAYSYFLDVVKLTKFTIWNWLCFLNARFFFKLDLVFSILMWGEQFQQSIYIGMDILGVLNPIGECKVLLKLALLEHSGSGQKF